MDNQTMKNMACSTRKERINTQSH